MMLKHNFYVAENITNPQGSLAMATIYKKASKVVKEHGSSL